MSLTNTAIKRPVFTMMIYATILIVGLVAVGSLSLDFLPDITFPAVIILTQYSGVGPQEMETSITRVIEGAVASAEGIDKLTATSAEGLSVVMVQFKWGQNLDAATTDLRDKLDLVRDYIPDGATKPTIFKISTANIPVMFMGITGNRPVHELYDIADRKLKDIIEQVPGVASMSIEGFQKREIQVILHRNRMDAYGFAPADIVNTLRSENINSSGGLIKQGNTQFTLRTQGEFRDVEEVRNIVLAYRRGVPIYLSYVADVNWGVSEQVSTAKFDGKRGIRLIVRKQSGANTVAVVQALQKKISQLQQVLPQGVTVYEAHNTADFVTRSIGSVSESGIMGGILAVLVVLFFLRNVRASLIIALAIPTSILGTFIAMFFSKVTLNMISLGGLALGVGMLVDNAIVVLENTYTYLHKGQKPAEAARLGSQEVAMAIFSSTLTTVCVFLPIVFTGGMASEIFKEMALTVTFSLLASLFVAMTLVPMLSAKFLKLTDESFMKQFKPKMYRAFTTGERFLTWLDNKYRDGIAWVLSHRRRVSLIVLGVFLLTFILIFPALKMEFMPETDEGFMNITIELPVGTRLEVTDQAVSQLNRIVDQIFKGKEREIKTRFFVSGNLGGFASIFSGTGSHIASYRLRLVDRTKRDTGIKDYVKIVTQEIQKAPAPLGVASSRISTQGGGGMGSGYPIDILVRGYDLKKGSDLAREIVKILEANPDIYNIENSRKEGVPEYRIQVNRVKAASMGINMAAITTALEYSILGKTATYFREEGREIDIFVRLREEDRRAVHDIENIQVRSPYTQRMVRIGNIAKVVRDSGPVKIERDAQERVIHVTCSTFGGLQQSVAQIRKAIGEKVVIPEGFTLEYSGNFKDMQETNRDLFLALLVAIFLVFAVMASIFESFLDPFIILFTIPLSLIGVIWALYVTRTSFSVNAMIGILVLAGVVVNNGIVLVDYINILRGRGMKLHDAIVEGGRRRLRPILMTTLTTILALLPMAFGLGEGSESTVPLARSVVGGLTVSTALSLFVIPVIYSIFETFSLKRQARKAIRRERRRRKRIEKYGMAGG